MTEVLEMDIVTGCVHIRQEGGDIYAQGGHIAQSPRDDGSLRIQVTGGRFAKRTGEQTADIYCGDCGAAVELLQEGAPLTDRDILDALTRAAHTNCPARAGEAS